MLVVSIWKHDGLGPNLLYLIDGGGMLEQMVVGLWG